MKGRLNAWQIARAALSFGSVEHGFSVADRALRRFERMAEILKPLFGFSEIIVVFRPASQGQAPHSAKRPGEEVRVAGPVIASGGPIEWGAVVWGPERLSAETAYHTSGSSLRGKLRPPLSFSGVIAIRVAKA